MIRGKRKREAFKTWRRWNPSPLMATFVLLIIYPAMLAAQGTVRIERPLDSEIRDTYHVRDFHPSTGVANVPHWGTDFRAQTPTPIVMKTGGSLICPNGNVSSGNAGIIGQVDHGCGVVEQFFHLSSCTASGGMVTGSTGRGTGPHLHHEVMLDGVKVNPERTYGVENLCDADTKKEIIEASKGDMNGLTKAGGGAGTNTGGQPAPPTQGGITYVPPGGTNPITGAPNTGGGYYIIDHGDGRTEIVLDIGNDIEGVPGIPAGDPADLTPSTETDNEVTGCAADTWTAMVNQSVLQTRREMIANQTYIAKPDSVMAYACLTDQMKYVWDNAGPIFSETKRWVNVEVDILGKTVNVNKELGDSSLDGAIINLALEPYEEFMADNFSYDFLGGTEGAAHTDHGDHVHAHTQAWTPCGAMSKIWQMAKCRNADDPQMFYSFEELINNDPRVHPEGYSCQNTGITQAMIDTAKGAQVQFDAVDTHLDLLFPGEDGQCAPPVMTGVTVVRREIGEFTAEEDAAALDPEFDLNSMRDPNVVSNEKNHADGVCLTAGCVYNVNINTYRPECVVERTALTPPPEETEPPPTGLVDTEDPAIRAQLEYQRLRAESMRQ